MARKTVAQSEVAKYLRWYNEQVVNLIGASVPEESRGYAFAVLDYMYTETMRTFIGADKSN